MKNNKLALTLALAFGLTGLARADGLAAIQAVDNEAGISFTRTNLDYHEPDSLYSTGTPNLDRESGNVNGFTLNVSVLRNLLLGNDYLAAKISRVSGTVGYYGFRGGGTAYNGASGATLLDYSLRYGHAFVADEAAVFVPYLEIGRHTWSRNVGNGVPGGYAENYQHNYVGVGVLAQYAVANSLVVSADLMTAQMFGAHISVSSSGLNENLGNNPIVHVGLNADYAVWQNVHLTASMGWTHYSYGESAMNSTGYYEPASATGIRTASVGLAYSF